MKHFLTIVALLLCSSTWASNYTVTTVTNSDSWGPGSLDQAVQDAAANGTPDSILLTNITDTIFLVQALSIIHDTVVFVGPTTHELVIDGNNGTRLLSVEQSYVAVYNLVLANGKYVGTSGIPGSPGVPGLPGPPASAGAGGQPGSGGQPGWGGAVNIGSGFALFHQVTFTGNVAQGGTGGPGGPGGPGYLGIPGVNGTHGVGGMGGAGTTGTAGSAGSPGGSGGSGGGGSARGGAIFVAAGALLTLNECVMHSNSAVGGISAGGGSSTGVAEGDAVYVDTGASAVAYGSYILGSTVNLFTCGLQADLSAWENTGSGNALSLDGVDDEFQIPSDSTLDVATSFTLSFWMKSEENGSHGYDGLVWKKPGTNYTDATGWFIEADGTSNLLFYGGGATEANWTVDPFGTDGRWHHVAVTVLNDSARLYWDGIDQGNKAIGSISANSEPIILGSDPQSSDRHFKGKLDEVRLWQAALSEAEIRAWMCQKLTNSHPKVCQLRANYRFDEALSDSLGLDLVSNNHGAFLNGASRTVSGAPIGDLSTYDYSGTSASLTLNHVFGSATANNFTGDLTGAHMYFVAETPNDSTAANFGGELFLHAAAGTFIAGGTSSSYDVRFDHGALIQSAITGISEYMRIARRASNAAGPWYIANTFAESHPTHITACGQSQRNEFALFWDTAYAPQQIVACGPHTIGNVQYDTTGLYADTLTSAGGCDSIVQVLLYIPELEIDSVVGTNTSCTANGSASMVLSNSAPATSYLWSDGQTTMQATGLATGTYSATVTTATPCTLQTSVTITNLDPCPTPTGLRSLFEQDTTAILEWDTVCGATAYKVQWKVAGAASWNTAIKNANQGRWTLNGLTPATIYKWRIVAKCGGVFSTPTGLKRFVTLAQPCAIPGSLSAGPTTATHVRLNWALVPNAVSYKIRWREVGTSSWTVVPKDGTKNKHWLNPGPLSVQYEWQIKTLCAPGNITGTRWSAVQTTGGFTPKWEQQFESGTNDGLDLIVFPNPAHANAQLRFSAGEPMEVQLEIISTIGRVVQQQQFAYTSGQLTLPIDLTNVATGTYIVRLRTAQSTLYRKLVIEGK